jgi:hypothetical protein
MSSENLDEILNTLKERLNEPMQEMWKREIDGKSIYFQIPPLGNIINVKDIARNKRSATTARYWKEVLDMGSYNVYKMNGTFNIVDKSSLCLMFDPKLIIDSKVKTENCGIFVCTSDYLQNESNRPYVKKLR